MKRSSPRLLLSRQTARVLTQRDLHVVQGASIPSSAPGKTSGAPTVSTTIEAAPTISQCQRHSACNQVCQPL